jgi:hypothetical protein
MRAADHAKFKELYTRYGKLAVVSLDDLIRMKLARGSSSIWPT